MPSPDVVVAGDVTVDWLLTSRPPVPVAGGTNWAVRTGARMSPLPGGAALLARAVRRTTGADVAGPDGEPVRTLLDKGAITSLLQLAPSPATRAVAETVFRVARAHGFDCLGTTPYLPPLRDDRAGPLVLVLQDDGNGFGDDPVRWPISLQDKEPPPARVVLRCRTLPRAGGKLWERIQSLPSTTEVYTVVGADDLRAGGISISRRLSWERTATDLVWALTATPELAPASNRGSLIVLFGQDGAAHIPQGRTSGWLHFDPKTIEDEYRERHPGQMIGCMLAFLASLVAHIALPPAGGTAAGLDALGRGIRRGIAAARRWHVQGFGADVGRLDFPIASLPAPTDTDPTDLYEVPIPERGNRAADQNFWSILQSRITDNLETVARRVVTEGEDAALAGVPVLRLGGIGLIDRNEIESYRSIRNLFREYLDAPTPKRPLSIAVFGKPGTGKSRGVRELANAIAPDVIVPFEVNVAQLAGPGDLAIVLRRAQNACLVGKVPLLFLDEFDVARPQPFAWVQSFLDPMQRGTFTDAAHEYQVGKAIFVFVGGTSSTFQQFAAGGKNRTAEKVPDFISRLRGFLNILGPDRTDDRDRYSILRRAVQIRSVLTEKAGHLFESNRLRINAGVLRALLTIPEYEHGIRSIEAVVEMSLLAGRQSYEKAGLPPEKQLGLHVRDADLFYRLVLSEELLEDGYQSIARLIHESHRAIAKNVKAASDPSMKEWEHIDDTLRNAILARARNIPSHLQAVGFDLRPCPDGRGQPVTFSDEVVESISRRLHDEWLKWSTEAKITGNPNQVDWNHLSEDVQNRNRQMALQIPGLLLKSGFEVYSLDMPLPTLR